MSFSRRSALTSAVACGFQCIALACAPSQAFRPAGMLDFGRGSEVGLGVSRVSPRPYINEASQYLGQAWWSTKLDTDWSLSAIGAFDEGSAAGGAALRFDIASGRWAALATEVEGGLFWAAFSVPMSFRVWRSNVLYTAPRLGTWGPEITPFIPLGASVQIAETLALRAEAELSWAGFEYYNRRLHGGLAIAHQW